MEHLVSGSESVVVWRVQVGSPAEAEASPLMRATPHGTGAQSSSRCLAWSPANTAIASGCEDGSIALVHPVTGQVLAALQLEQTQPQQPPRPGSASSPPSSPDASVLGVCFRSSKSHLLSACRDQAVRLWDVRKRVVVRTFAGHKAAVTCVEVNKSDSHIASGSMQGEVLVHRLDTGQEVAALPKLTGKPRKPITQVLFSPFRSRLLAVASDDQLVRLWDTDKNALALLPAVHQAPVTGVSFSPINKDLLCSIGLDKRLVFYDVREKRIVNEVRAESPLTSSSFMSNGVHVATGTSSGTVCLWDLRMCSRAAFELAAHDSNPVYSVRFQSAGADLPSVPSGMSAAARLSLAAPRASLAPSTLSTHPDDRSAISATELGDVLSPVQAKPRMSMAADGIAGSQLRQARLSRVSGVTPAATFRPSIIPSDPVLSPIVPATPASATSSTRAHSMLALQTPLAVHGARPSIAANTTAAPSVVTATPIAAAEASTSTMVSLPLDFLSPVASKKKQPGDGSSAIGATTPTPAVDARAAAVPPTTATITPLYEPPAASIAASASISSIPPQYEFESVPGGIDNLLLSPLRPSSFAVLQARESLQPQQPLQQRSFGHSFAQPPSAAAHYARLSMADSVLSPMPSTSAPTSSKPAALSRSDPESDSLQASATALPELPTSAVSSTAVYEPSPLLMRQQPPPTAPTAIGAAPHVSVAYTRLPAPSASTTSNVVAEFQLDLVRGMLEESVNSLRDSMHHEIQNLHIDLVRQFEIQQQQLVAILGDMRAQQEATLRELDALRLENERLKHLIA